MSAIFGQFNLDSAPVDRDQLELMRVALSDLGPDGGGVWVAGAVGFGHGLMCFTPEDRFERQPVWDAEGQHVLVADARIDNRRELAQAFGLSPAECAGLPDSSLILRSYARWGVDCLHHLIGEFAFALWDVRTQQLLGARSPLGQRTFYYHATAHTLAFATMPRGLFALPFIPRQLDEEAVARFTATYSQGAGATLYRGIHRLPAGHRLLVDRQGIRAGPYWQLPSADAFYYPSDDDYLEAFDALFRRVVDDHLRSLSPVGVAISGGLDSSSVAALVAARLGEEGKRLAAFTEVPRPGFDGFVPMGRYADETSFVQAFARRYRNVDLNLVQTSDLWLLEDVDAYFATAEIPLFNMFNRVWWEEIQRQARGQGIRVILTGEMGNLTVSWDGRGLLAFLVRQGRWRQTLREARASVQTGLAHSVLRTLVGNGIVPNLPTPIADRIRSMPGLFRKQTRLPSISILHPDYAAAHKFVADSPKRTADLWSRTDLRKSRRDILTDFDIAGNVGTAYRARFGVESRSPLTDVRLVEFCLNLPEEQYRANGKTRRLIRRAMAHRLPPEILDNTQRGMQAADWRERLAIHRAQIAAELAEFDQNELARTVLNLRDIRAYLDELVQGREVDEYVALYKRGTLEAVLIMGRFLRWFQPQNGD